LGGADVGMAQEFFGGEDVGVRAFCEFPAPGVAEVMPGAGFGNVGFELGVTQGVFHGVQADGGHRRCSFCREVRRPGGSLFLRAGHLKRHLWGCWSAFPWVLLKINSNLKIKSEKSLDFRIYCDYTCTSG